MVEINKLSVIEINDKINYWQQLWKNAETRDEKYVCFNLYKAYSDLLNLKKYGKVNL